jgi:uncharacterized repeat protein (TIGR02543 family)
MSKIISNKINSKKLSFSLFLSLILATLFNCFIPVKSYGLANDLNLSLKLNGAGPSCTSASNGGIAGNGNSGTPYQIKTIQDLECMATLVNSYTSTYSNKYWTLMSDIDLNSGTVNKTPTGWIPIGNNNTFVGTFNGGGHTISNLHINKTSDAGQGLFGDVNSITINDLGLVGGSIDVVGGSSVGSLVGWTWVANIANSYNTVNITANNSYAGGLIGGIGTNASIPTFTNVYNTGNISGGGYTGGLVGAIYDDVSVSNSYNTGNISGNVIRSDGTSSAGGLVGKAHFASIITNAYNIGNINSVGDAGGLFGTMMEENLTITNSYNTGDVKGARDYSTGGLVGNQQLSTLTITNSVDLSKTIAGTSSATNRILGSGTLNSGSKAYSYIYTSVNGSYRAGVNAPSNSKDGQNIQCGDIYNPTFWANLAFNISAWNPIAINGTTVTLPTLKNLGGTQNPIASFQCEVTFDPNGGTPATKYTLQMTYGDVLQMPNDYTEPTKQGFEFAGWYATTDCSVDNPSACDLNKRYRFNSTHVYDSISLFAFWADITVYNVTFYKNDGSSISTIDHVINTHNTHNICENREQTAIDDLTSLCHREGYSFTDTWYTSEDLSGTPFDFDTPITDNLSLYALWIINSYTVAFDSNDGSSVEPQTIEYNKKVLKPRDPIKDGYTFVNWYLNFNLSGTSFNFNMPITQNITLYARWIENGFTPDPDPTPSPSPTDNSSPTDKPTTDSKGFINSSYITKITSPIASKKLYLYKNQKTIKLLFELIGTKDIKGKVYIKIYKKNVLDKKLTSKSVTVNKIQTFEIKPKKNKVNKNTKVKIYVGSKSYLFTVYIIKNKTDIKKISSVVYPKTIKLKSKTNTIVLKKLSPSKSTTQIPTFKVNKSGLKIDKSGVITSATKKGTYKITIKVGKAKKVISIKVS